MKKKITKDYRVRFVTKDGSIVMNRECSEMMFGSDKEFIEHSLKKDASARGLRIVSSKLVDSCTLEALVEWC